MVKSEGQLALGFGCAALGLSVLLGAFAAHALDSSLSDYSKLIWQKALFYQVFHGVGLVLVGILARLDLISARLTRISTGLMVFGVLLFSGSLYLLALTGLRWLGAITPFGGVMFIVVWGLLTWSIWREK